MKSVQQQAKMPQIHSCMALHIHLQINMPRFCAIFSVAETHTQHVLGLDSVPGICRLELTDC